MGCITIRVLIQILPSNSRDTLTINFQILWYCQKSYKMKLINLMMKRISILPIYFRKRMYSWMNPSIKHREMLKIYKDYSDVFLNRKWVTSQKSIIIIIIHQTMGLAVLKVHNRNNSNSNYKRYNNCNNNLLKSRYSKKLTVWYLIHKRPLQIWLLRSQVLHFLRIFLKSNISLVRILSF